MKKTKYLLIVAGMTMLTFTGCGKEKVTAEELVNGVAAKEESKVADIGVTLDFGAAIPIDEDNSSTMSMAIEARIKNTEKYAHMDGNMKINILGMDMNEQIDTWYDLDEKKTYTFNADADQWTVEDTEENFDVTLGAFENVDSSIFTDLTLKEVDKEEDYEVTATIDSDSLSKIIGDENVVSDMGFDELMDDSESITLDVTMTFDRSTKDLKTMVFDIDASQISDLEEVDVNKFQLGFTIYQLGGTLDLTIPDDVKDNAVESLDDDYDFGDWDSDDDWEFDSDDDWEFDDDDDWNIDFDDEEDDSWEDDPETVKEDLLGLYPELSDADGTIGVYNGTNLGIGVDYSVFTKDGWKTDDSEGMSFIFCENEKYPGVDLYLYDFGWTGEESNLKKTGIWGYRLDASLAQDAKKLPPLKCKGLTWGASAEDVIAAYGEANMVSETDEYSTYSYDYGDCQLTFTIYGKDYAVQGLATIELMYY